MCHDGEVLALQWGECEDTPYRCQFFAREAAYDTCFTEQSLYGRVTGGNGACVA